jgi:hypothetical protein
MLIEARLLKCGPGLRSWRRRPHIQEACVVLKDHAQNKELKRDCGSINLVALCGKQQS